VVIRKEEFKSLSYWLMLNLDCVNGHRAQAAVLFKNKHYMGRKTVSGDVSANYRDIVIDRSALSDGQLTSYCIGVADSEYHGKTDPIRLMLPHDLSRAMDNYRCVKDHLGLGTSGNPSGHFFVNKDGKALNLKNYTNFMIVQEMAAVMGVDKLHVTDARHGQATRMREKGLTNELGCSHSAETQEKYYDNCKEAQGISNKSIANSEMLAKKVMPLKSLDNTDHLEYLEQMRKKDAENIEAYVQQKKIQ